MKTPEHWGQFIADSEVMQSRAETVKFAATIAAEIQRDAREGMVPYEDVRVLVGAFTDPSQDGDDFIEAFRTKHPNLFT